MNHYEYFCEAYRNEKGNQPDKSVKKLLRAVSDLLNQGQTPEQIADALHTVEQIRERIAESGQTVEEFFHLLEWYEHQRETGATGTPKQSLMALG